MKFISSRAELIFYSDPNRTCTEPQNEEIEDFLALLRFDQRSKLEGLDLEFELVKGGSA